MTEPVAAGQPEPFGIARTFGWAAIASIAGLLSGAPLMLALAYSSWAPLNLTDALAFGCIGATIAEVAFFGVVVRACRWRGWRATDYLGLVRPRGNYLRSSLSVYVLTTAVSIVASTFGPLIEDANSLLEFLPPGYFVFEVAVVAPIGEELVFRGFLYRGLAASRLGVTGAILVTSLLWTGLHIEQTWLGLADLFFSGVAFGWLRWRSDSAITPIAVHGVNNIVAALVYLLFP